MHAGCIRLGHIRTRLLTSLSVPPPSLSIESCAPRNQRARDGSLNSILGQFEIADLAVRTLEESADVLINDWTTGGVMTIIQAAGLRVKGKQRVDPPQGEHLNLELE